MVFGFLPAVITGFLLTAIPNWTDRPPIEGHELMLLCNLVAGRTPADRHAMVSRPSCPPSLTGRFLSWWQGWSGEKLPAAKSWDRAPMGVLVSLLAGANILFHVLNLSGTETDLPERMALAMVMMLLALIGGRVTPNFTGEFLTGSGRAEQPASFSRYDGLSIALVGFAVVSWIVQPHSMATGWIFVAAGLANLGRLVRWYGWAHMARAVGVDPALWIWLVGIVAAHTGRLDSRGWSAERRCGACVYQRRSGRDDSGGDDPCQPGPYGAPPARGSSDGPASIYWSTWVPI